MADQGQARKKIVLTALRKNIEARAMVASRKVLEDFAVDLVSEAQKLAPVRQSFKNANPKKRTRSIVGTDLDVGIKGKGSRMLVRRRDRNPLNLLRGPKAFVLGKTDYYATKSQIEVSRFHPRREKGVGAVATVTSRTGRLVPNRSGKGSHRERIKGYQLAPKYDQQLTSRARYNIARGIGIHKTVTGTTGGSAYVIGGALRDSIEATRIEPTKNGWQFELRATVRYAPYVEFGTWKDEAQPFMRPAIKNSKKLYRGKIKDHFNDLGFEVKG